MVGNLMGNPLRVLVVGCGRMGIAHARAYHKLDEFKIIGLVSRQPESRKRLSQELGGLPTFSNFDVALSETRPDVVSINTYPETHAEYAVKSLNADAHVFVEKPLATTLEDAQTVVALAKKQDRKLVVGYILRVHPVWKKFIEIARTLGKPLVMRMNLNQQSDGTHWLIHKNLLHSVSPIVDCGVHYVDVMCQMTGSRPLSVHAIGANLTDEIAADQYNYEHLQIRFEDGSVGWYESGWGPMMSETASFIKDVVGPKGSISIVDTEVRTSSGIITNVLRLHHGSLDHHGQFKQQDEWMETEDEPSHDRLCELEQIFLLNAIKNSVDLSDHLSHAVNSLKIVLAAHLSIQKGTAIKLQE